MSKLQQAVDNTSNLAKMYRGVLELHDACSEIGNLETYKSDLEKAVEGTKKETEKVNAQLAEVSEKIKNEQKILEDLKVEVSKIKDNYKEEAKKEATTIIDEAKIEANDMKKKATEEIDKIRAKTKEAEARLASFNTNIAAAENTLKRINDAIAEARKKIG